MCVEEYACTALQVGIATSLTPADEEAIPGDLAGLERDGSLAAVRHDL
jgi:hypothetical protein